MHFLRVCVIVNGRHQNTSLEGRHIPLDIQPKWSDILTFGRPSPSSTHFSVALYAQPEPSEIETDDILLFSTGRGFPLFVLLTCPLTALQEATHFCPAEHPLKQLSSGKVKIDLDFKSVLGSTNLGFLTFSINTGGYKSSSLLPQVCLLQVSSYRSRQWQ